MCSKVTSDSSWTDGAEARQAQMEEAGTESAEYEREKEKAAAFIDCVIAVGMRFADIRKRTFVPGDCSGCGSCSQLLQINNNTFFHEIWRFAVDRR